METKRACSDCNDTGYVEYHDCGGRDARCRKPSCEGCPLLRVKREVCMSCLGKKVA